MWADVEDAAPIIAITNGVHVGTWQDPRVPAALAGDARWPRHARELKARAARGGRRGATGRAACDPDALTIGFARRAATYKRPDLLLREPRRASRASSSEARVAGALRRQGAPRGPRTART